MKIKIAIDGWDNNETNKRQACENMVDNNLFRGVDVQHSSKSPFIINICVDLQANCNEIGTFPQYKNDSNGL